MGKISLDYGKCNTVISEIDNAITKASIDYSNLRNALSYASGCYGDPSAEIRQAMNDINNFKDDLLDFKKAFSNLVVDIKKTDINYRRKLDKVYEVYDAFRNGSVNILTSGTNGGIGAYKTVVGSLSANCYLQLIDGDTVRIVGSEADRIAYGINGRGATYKIGSPSYYAAGLDKFVLNGTSASEFRQTYIRNLGNTATNTIDSFRMNPGAAVRNFNKSTFGFQAGDKLGNFAKGLSYAAIAYETGLDTYDNVKSGASGSKIAADVTVDVAKGLGGMAVATACANVGAAIGTAIPIPVVGTAVGAVVGFAAGYAGAWVYNTLIDGVEIKGKTVAEWASTGIEHGIDAVGDGLSKAADAVGSFFSGLGEFAFG